jgi:hypothetical protein
LPSFDDTEMEAILSTAATLDREKRSVFLARVVAAQRLDCSRGIEDVISRALVGLLRQPRD